MYRIDSCLCCGSRELRLVPALVSPFVASYVLHRQPELCELAHCVGCGCRFFLSRLTEAEAGALYTDYRGEAYFRERHRVEFWYTEELNRAGLEPGVVTVRTELIENELRAHIDPSTLTDTLDFGGDRGQLIPPGVGPGRFVFDLSGAEPVPGVTSIAAEAELLNKKFDLVLVNAVLEHCSDPGAVLSRLRPLARSESSLFYIEVPFERPWLGMGWGPLYRWYLRALASWYRALLWVDFYSTALRVRLSFVPPLGFVKLHEHLNFFTEESLDRLLVNRGFLLRSCALRSYRVPGLGRSKVLCCVASVQP